MSEGLQYTPKDVYKGDFDESVLNPEFQKELADENYEIESRTESELSREAIEIILSKVKDIDQYGTAFSMVDFYDWGEKKSDIAGTLKSVLQLGLLGGVGDPTMDQKTRVEEWKKISRENWSINKIWFNIVGRMKRIKNENQIKEASVGTGVGIIFDLSKYNEIIPGSHRGMKEGQLMNTFSANRDLSILEKFSQAINRDLDYQNKKMPECWGFTIPYRIAPRRFQGIVIGKQRIDEVEEMVRIMKSMSNGENDQLLPIYDMDCNLLWPKQMSHEEIGQFIAERDQQRTEQEDHL